MYYDGRGVKQDYEESVHWLRKSAEQGSVLAQYSLGKMYKYGVGVEKNMDEARRWLQKAADQGDEEAKEQLKQLRKILGKSKPQ